MYQVKKNTTVAGVSELRSHSNEIINSAKKGDIILQRHSEPVAVVLNYERYLALEALLEKYEDEFYEQLITKRMKNVKKDDFIDIEKW